MKPCILLFPVTICYIICGIHGVWQSNGRGFIFRGLDGTAGQLHLRGKDSAIGYNVGDTNYVSNEDITPIIIPLNGVEDSFGKGEKSSANEHDELAPQVSAVNPIKEHGNEGLIGDESNANGNLNYAMQNDEGELQSSEMHSSEEEDHEFNSNSFNTGGETNDDINMNMLTSNIVDDNLYDERQNNTSASLNVGMKANADVNIGGHNQVVDLSSGVESSASNLNIAAQNNINEKGDPYFYPPYSVKDSFNIGAKEIASNLNLPIQGGFHNINFAAKGDVESGNFAEGKECSCSSKSKGSPITAQNNAIHGLYNEGQVNGGAVFNSEILNGGGYNIGTKGITSSYYNLPVQNNKIHGFYNEWQGNEGRNPNIAQIGGVFNKPVKGVTNGYLNYPVQDIHGVNKGTLSGGGGYINFQHDNSNNGLYALGDPRPSGGGSGLNVGEVTSSYFNYPVPYNANHRPYFGDSTYFSVNGHGGRDINMKTQGGDERGYNVAGHYYNLPKQDSMIQGFDTGSQIKEGSFNAKGNGIASNNYNVAVHGHNLTDNANHEVYTGGPVITNGGLNVGIQNGGGYSSKMKGNSINNSYYKLPTHIHTEDSLHGGEQSNKGSFNIAAKDNREVYNIEGKGLPIQSHLANLNLPGANTNSNFNHASQNFKINSEQINKGTSPYFKIQEDGKGGFYFVPFRVLGCSCQHTAGLPIDNITSQPKLTDSLNGEVQGNVEGKLETNAQINIEGGIETDGSSHFEGNSVGKANLIGDMNNGVQNDDLVVGGELINLETDVAERGKLIGNLNNGAQSIMESRLNGNTQANIGKKLNVAGLSKLKGNIIGQDNLNSQVNSLGFSNIKGNIAHNNFMNDIHAIGFDSSDKGFNGNLHQGSSHFPGGVGAGEFIDLGGQARWFSDFEGGINPLWFRNIGSEFTNFLDGTYAGTGNGYIHGLDSHKAVLNNGAHVDSGFLDPQNKVNALNSEEFAHFKGQLNLIEGNNDNPLYKIIVRKGNTFGGLKGKPPINFNNIFKEKPQNNVNGGLYSDNFKTIGSRLDGNRFKNTEEEFNNHKIKNFKLNPDKTAVFAPWHRNNTRKEILKEKLRNYLLKILTPKQAEELGLNYHVVNGDQLNASDKLEYSNTGDNKNNKFNNYGIQFNKDKIGLATPWYQNNVGNRNLIGNAKDSREWGVNHQAINKDQLNASNRLGYSEQGYRLPKLGPIGRQINFRPGYSGRFNKNAGRLRGYSNIFRG